MEGTKKFLALLFVAAALTQTSARSHKKHGDHSSESSQKNGAHKTFDNSEFNEVLKVRPNLTSDLLSRPGKAGSGSSCSHVTQLPDDVKAFLSFKAKKFYGKFTEAYGIPVLSHGSVPDAALKRACYVLRFLLADRQDLREAFYSEWGRVVVLAKEEFVHDIPEYSSLKEFLEFESMSSLKAMPGSSLIPVSTASEENLLCRGRSGRAQHRHASHSNLHSLADPSLNESLRHHHHLHKTGRHHHHHSSKYPPTELDVDSSSDNRNESQPPLRSSDGKIVPVPKSMPDDIFLKTLSIGILNTAVANVSPSLKRRLDRAYHHAMASGWWINTESASGPESYFGEGVQSFYDANAYSSPPDGFSNDINLRTKLRSYDTALYSIVQEVFPCANSYLKRCSSRGNEAHLHIDMDCPIPQWN